MTDPLVLQLGTGGVLALLIIREVLAFANSRKNNSDMQCPADTVTKDFCDERHNGTIRLLERLEKKVDELPGRINGKEK